MILWNIIWQLECKIYWLMVSPICFNNYLHTLSFGCICSYVINMGIINCYDLSYILKQMWCLSVCVFNTDSVDMGQRARQGQAMHVCKDQLPLRLHLWLHHHWMACLCLTCKGHLRTGACRGCPAWRCGCPPAWRCQGQQPPTSAPTTSSINS
jgi:hypothetical protein